MELCHNAAVDSACARCKAEGKTPEECADTVDWVQKRDGTREYVCAEHARDLARFGTPVEELPETPHADPCRACNKLTRHEDLHAGANLCKACTASNERVEDVTETGMTFEAAVDLVDTLMDEDEDVDPETAAEAVERLSGMPMVPREEAIEWANTAAEDPENPHLPAEYRERMTEETEDNERGGE